MAGTTSTKTTRRPRIKVDPNETPESKFIRLANVRGEKFNHLMKLLKNLGTSYAYKMDVTLAKKLLAEFEGSFNELKLSWEATITKLDSKSEN
jgi:hypothetical protein